MRVQAESVGSMRVGSRWPAILAAMLVCLVASLLLAVRLEDGITFLSFWDEATHVLGGKVLDSGGTLYRSFVDSHGPFIFLLTAIYGRLSGWSDPNMARLINVVLVVASAASIAACPALRTPVARLWGVGLFAGLPAAVWLPQGLFMISYYLVAGALAGLVLTGFTLGCWQGVPPSRSHAILAGLAAACVVGTAYSYGPSVLLFFRRRAVVGVGVRVAPGGGWLPGRPARRRDRAPVWLLIFADLRGYLAFHFAESQFDYALHSFLGRTVRAEPAGLGRAGSAGARPCRRRCRSGLRDARRRLDTRPAGGRMATAPGAGGRLPRRDAAERARRGRLPGRQLRLRDDRGAGGGARRAAAAFELAGCADGRVAGGAAGGRGRHGVDARRVVYAEQVVSAGTGPDAALAGRQPIGRPAVPAYPGAGASGRGDPRRRLRSAGLLLADRMPMDGFYAYFAWDADYARSPWFGRPRDLCVALRDRPPPVILYKDDGVWGYRPSRYVPCVLALLHRFYVEDRRVIDQRGALYVRRDRAALIR